MKPEAFRQLVESIFDAKEEELLCSDFFALLPRFVDVRLGGGDADRAFPDVSHHLRQCPECDEVYRGVLDAASSGDASQPT